MKNMTELMSKIDQAIASGDSAIKDLISELDTRNSYILRAKLMREEKMTPEIDELLIKEDPEGA